MQPNFISYPVIKLLAQEQEKEPEKQSIEKETHKTNDLITILYNTFFSTGIETNKQKET